MSRPGDDPYKSASPGFVIFVQRTIEMMNAEGRSLDWRNVPQDILRQIERNWEGLSSDHRRDFENQGLMKDNEYRIEMAKMSAYGRQGMMGPGHGSMPPPPLMMLPEKHGTGNSFYIPPGHGKDDPKVAKGDPWAYQVGPARGAPGGAGGSAPILTSTQHKGSTQGYGRGGLSPMQAQAAQQQQQQQYYLQQMQQVMQQLYPGHTAGHMMSHHQQQQQAAMAQQYMQQQQQQHHHHAQQQQQQHAQQQHHAKAQTPSDKDKHAGAHAAHGAHAASPSQAPASAQVSGQDRDGIPPSAPAHEERREENGAAAAAPVTTTTTAPAAAATTTTTTTTTHAPTTTTTTPTTTTAPAASASTASTPGPEERKIKEEGGEEGAGVRVKTEGDEHKPQEPTARKDGAVAGTTTTTTTSAQQLTPQQQAAAAAAAAAHGYPGFGGAGIDYSAYMNAYNSMYWPPMANFTSMPNRAGGAAGAAGSNGFMMVPGWQYPMGAAGAPPAGVFPGEHKGDKGDESPQYEGTDGRRKPQRKRVAYTYAVVADGKCRQRATHSVTRKNFKDFLKGLSKEGYEVIRCRCGHHVEDGEMVRCDDCEAWQHCVCMGVQPDSKEPYKCDTCSPRDMDRNIEVPPPQNAEPGATYYKVLFFGETRFTVGECVYISNDPTSTSRDIVRIEQLFVKDGEQLMYGYLFYRPTEVQAGGRKYYKSELFSTRHGRTCALSCIRGRCCVMDIASWRLGRPAGFTKKDIFVCEFRYDPKSKKITPYKSKRWGPVCETMVFEDFETPVELPRTICYNAEGQEITAPVEPKPTTVSNSDAYGCQVCLKPYNSWNGLKYHLKNKHPEVSEDDYVFKRMAAYEGASSQAADTPPSPTPERKVTAAATSSVASSATPAAATASAQQASSKTAERVPVTFTYRRPYVADDDEDEPIRPAKGKKREAVDDDDGREYETRGKAYRNRRRRYGKFIRPVPPAHKGELPPIGPLTVEVLVDMPQSRSFIVRCMRNDKVFQGVCVEQEVTPRAAVPRTRFSRAFLSGELNDESDALLARGLDFECKFDGCGLAFDSAERREAHMADHRAQGDVDPREYRPAGRHDRVVCPYPKCSAMFDTPRLFASHVLEIHGNSALGTQRSLDKDLAAPAPAAAASTAAASSAHAPAAAASTSMASTGSTSTAPAAAGGSLGNGAASSGNGSAAGKGADHGGNETDSDEPREPREPRHDGPMSAAAATAAVHAANAPAPPKKMMKTESSSGSDGGPPVRGAGPAVGSVYPPMQGYAQAAMGYQGMPPQGQFQPSVWGFYSPGMYPPPYMQQ